MVAIRPLDALWLLLLVVMRCYTRESMLSWLELILVVRLCVT